MKMKKMFSVILAVFMLMVCFSSLGITASAKGVFDGAIKIDEMEYYSKKFKNGYDYLYYKITIPSNGQIELRCNEYLGEYFVRIGFELFDSNANSIFASDLAKKNEIKDLKKGTYYLQMKVNGNKNYLSSYEDRMNYSNFYYTFTPDEKPTISLKMTVKKGSSIQLSAVTENYTGKITWLSTKKDVASISDKGVVKALKKGTTTIRATLSDGTYTQIKITVTA
mgnify:CR=1 FL=1